VDTLEGAKEGMEELLAQQGASIVELEKHSLGNAYAWVEREPGSGLGRTLVVDKSFGDAVIEVNRKRFEKQESRLEKLEEALDRHLQSHFNGEGASLEDSGRAPSGLGHSPRLAEDGGAKPILDPSRVAQSTPVTEHRYSKHDEIEHFMGIDRTAIALYPHIKEWPKNGLLLKDGKAIAVGDAGMVQTSSGPVWLTNAPPTAELVRYHPEFDPSASPQGIDFSVALLYLKAGRKVTMQTSPVFNKEKYLAMTNGVIRDERGFEFGHPADNEYCSFSFSNILSDHWLVLPLSDTEPA